MADGTTLENFVFNIVVKGGKVVKAEIEGVNAELDKTEAKAKKAGNGMDIFGKKILGVLGPLVGFGVVMKRVFNFAAQGEQLAFLAQEANVAAGKIQTLGKALKDYGGDSTTAANTLKNFNRQLYDLRRGMGGPLAETAWRFGLDLRGVKEGEQLLFRIAQRMEGLNTNRQLELGRALGLDPATLRLVQGGVENLNAELARASKFNVFSEQDIENSRKFQRGLRDAKDGLNAIWGVVARWLLPVFTTIAEKTSDFFLFLRRHEPFVIAFFTIISALMAAIAIKSAIAFWPLFLIIGFIIWQALTLGLVFDDLFTFIRGGDSIIGRFVKKMDEGIGWLVDKVKGKLEAIVNFFRNMWFNLIDGWNETRDFFADTWIGRQLGITKSNGPVERTDFKFVEGNKDYDKARAQAAAGYDWNTARGIYRPKGSGDMITDANAALALPAQAQLALDLARQNVNTVINNNIKTDVTVQGNADEGPVRDGVQQGIEATGIIDAYTSGGG